MKAKKKFLRPGAMNLSGLKKKWRKPRGKHAKIRLSRNGHGLIPKVGYGTGIKEKGLINGLLPVNVHSVKDIEALDKSSIGIIGSGVGKKKKEEMVKKAVESNIKLLNIKDAKLFLKKAEEEKAEKKKHKSKKEEEKKEKVEEKKKKDSKEDAETKEKEEKRKILEKGL